MFVNFDKKFDIAGFQFNPENGVSISSLSVAASFLNEDRFILKEVDGDNTIAYLLIGNAKEYELSPEMERAIEKYVVEILNDVNKETLDGVYKNVCGSGLSMFIGYTKYNL